MSKQTTFRIDGKEEPRIEYEVDKKIPNLYQKICIIMQKVSSVYKDAKVQTGGDGSYKAVSHDNVASLLHPYLAEQRIVVRPSVISRTLECAKVTTKYGDKDQFRTHLIVDVAFINADNPNERESCIIDGFALDSQDKGVGKSLSYAVKYAMLKMFVLESSDEEEQRVEEFKTNETKPLGGLRDKSEKQKTLKFVQDGITQILNEQLTREDKAAKFLELTGLPNWKDLESLSEAQLDDLAKNILFKHS